MPASLRAFYPKQVNCFVISQDNRDSLQSFLINGFSFPVALSCSNMYTHILLFAKNIQTCTHPAYDICLPCVCCIHNEKSGLLILKRACVYLYGYLQACV